MKVAELLKALEAADPEMEVAAVFNNTRDAYRIKGVDIGSCTRLRALTPKDGKRAFDLAQVKIILFL